MHHTRSAFERINCLTSWEIRAEESKMFRLVVLMLTVATTHWGDVIRTDATLRAQEGGGGGDYINPFHKQ